MCRSVSLLLLVCAGARMLAAQDPSFEVASIREVTGPFHVMRGWSASGKTLKLEAYTLRALIEEAYGLKAYQFAAESIPGAAREVYYSVEARAAGDQVPTPAQFRQMLRSLLVERFGLKVHREIRSIPVYQLVADKNPRLKPSTAETECSSFIGPVQPQDRNYRYRFVNCPLDRLVDTLEADRPIVDRTGLTGNYDIVLFATPELRLRNSVEPGDISLRDAIRSLGLRLNEAKAAVEIMVVDQVSPRPTAN
jgi:uncharacterized protein (TIGR03435 family)